VVFFNVTRERERNCGRFLCASATTCSKTIQRQRLWYFLLYVRRFSQSRSCSLFSRSPICLDSERTSHLIWWIRNRNHTNAERTTTITTTTTTKSWDSPRLYLIWTCFLLESNKHEDADRLHVKRSRGYMYICWEWRRRKRRVKSIK